MKDYQESLLGAALTSGALKFGEFTLKSGRKSPYYWNAGMMCDGRSVHDQAVAYGEIMNFNINFRNFDLIFGPAYKGIPIAATIVNKIYRLHSVNKRFAYDRKEVKEHGDPLDRQVDGRIEKGDRVVIVDDVITTGQTKKDEILLLDSLNKGLEYAGIVIALNRLEVDKDGRDPIKVLSRELRIPVYSILDSVNIFDRLHNKEFNGKIWVDDEKFESFQTYYKEFGVKG